MNLGLFDHPYADFLDQVSKPARYSGREHGTWHKDWSSVEARVCLAFPDVYDIGMSHLGFRILYAILNEDPKILAERCYAPWTDLWGKLLERQLPLISLESRRPLSEFDVVGFSLQFELCYTNVLAMLDLGGIALRACDRGNDAPLIIAGGPVATHPEPMAPFFDAILIGDGEQAASEIALAWTSAKRQGLPRRDRLARLSQIEGVYVPSLYGTGLADNGLEVVTKPEQGRAPFPVRRRLLEDLAPFPFPSGGPVGGPEAIFDRMSVEITRGCTEGCRFCQAGMIYRPVRERPPDQVIDTVLRAVEDSGQDEVSLSALSTADVSYISPLIKRLTARTAPERVSLGVSSLRAYGLGEDLLEELRKVRATGLTFAPEAGTQRLRDVINKNVTEEQLLETAERVFSRGWDRMKLYFILGLPTETDEDVLSIVEVGRRALAVGRRVSKKPIAVTLSASVHVPKPHTPFQWCAMDPLPEIHRKQELLCRAVRGQRGLELRLHDCRASVLEAILARGDRRLADVIEDAYRRGARFDSWEDEFRPDIWDEALDTADIDRAQRLGTFALEPQLPWDHLDVGLAPGFLAREYRRALKSRLSPPCGKPIGLHVHHTNVEDAQKDQKKLVCYDCGIACDLGKMRNQRIEYLARLGAEVPNRVSGQSMEIVDAEEVSVPGVGSPGALRPTAIPHPEMHRPVRDATTVSRWRLRFEKFGPMALLGHLDLIRELPRTLRRAGLRVAYTQGYHPKPHLSFGPALSLGVPSLDEYVDAALLDAPDRALLLTRLQEACAEGLAFVDAVPLPEGAPKLSRWIGGASYAVAMPEMEVQKRGGLSVFRERVQQWLRLETAMTSRCIKGREKRVDVRKFVEGIRIGDTADLEAIGRAGLIGRLCALGMVIRIEAEGSVKVGEVMSALFDQDPMPHRAVRAALLDPAGRPLGELLAELRDPIAPAKSAASG